MTAAAVVGAVGVFPQSSRTLGHVREVAFHLFRLPGDQPLAAEPVKTHEIADERRGTVDFRIKAFFDALGPEVLGQSPVQFGVSLLRGRTEIKSVILTRLRALARKFQTAVRGGNLSVSRLKLGKNFRQKILAGI